MQPKNIVLFLTAGFSFATQIEISKDESSSSCHSIATSAGELSQSAEAAQASSTSSLPVAETTVCTQQCVILTLVTLTTQALTSTSSVVPHAPVVSTSCSIITAPEDASIVSAQSAPETSSSVSTSEPCSTDITVTSTIVETLWSSLPLTTTLIRTRPVTVTTVIVETYSTSTGGKLVPATRTTTATLHQISVDEACSQAKGCCAACSIGETSQLSSAAFISSDPSTTGSLDSQDTARVSAAQTEASTTEVKTGDASVSVAGAAAATAGVGLSALVGLLVVLA